MVRAPYAELVAPVVTRGGLQLMLDQSRTRANIYFVVISGFPIANSTCVVIFNFPDTLIPYFLNMKITSQINSECGYQFLPFVK